MGFLSKTNPKATWGSVLRRAVVTSILGAGLYVSVIWWNRWLNDWPLKIAICAVLLALVAAVWEWQIPDDGGLTDIDA